MALDYIDNINDLYTLEKKLGEGHFGIVYLCTEKASNAKYACKCISKFKCILENNLHNVQREIEIMYHLIGHPNIVAIKGIYEDVRTIYLVMELCEGGELLDRINEKGTYTEGKTKCLMRTIVSTIEACHLLGVVHLDIKPENLLFQTQHEDSVLKFVDFGLSRFFEPGDVFTKVVGSPPYIAPEVLDGHYGPEADMWSIGVILYVLLSGKFPFEAKTLKGILEKIKMRQPPNFAKEPWTNISEGAIDLIQKLLNPDPSKRLKAFEVMKHPWIWEDNIATNKPQCMGGQYYQTSVYGLRTLNLGRINRHLP